MKDHIKIFVQVRFGDCEKIATCGTVEIAVISIFIATSVMDVTSKLQSSSPHWEMEL